MGGGKDAVSQHSFKEVESYFISVLTTLRRVLSRCESNRMEMITGVGEDERGEEGEERSEKSERRKRMRKGGSELREKRGGVF